MHGWYDTCFLVVCPEPAGPWVGCEPPHSGSPHPPVGDLLEANFLAAIQNAPKPSYIGWPDTAALHQPPWEPPVPWLSGTCQLYLDWTSMARVGVWFKSPGYEMVCTLIMVPQPRGEPLGVVQQLLHREGHLWRPQVLSSKITAPSECGSVQQLLSQWAAHDSLPTHCLHPAAAGPG